MADLLPVDTVVRVSERDRPSCVAKVVGYDLGRTKYHLGRRYMGWSEWLWMDGGDWAFPGEVEAIEEPS